MADRIKGAPKRTRRRITLEGTGGGEHLLQVVAGPHKDVAGTNPKDLLGMKKPPISLVPPAGMLHVAQAMGNGAAKYGPYNWRENKVVAKIYIDAAYRHIMAWMDGEEVAEDSGVHHLGHAAACLFILLDAQATGNLKDDRPIAGAAARLIKEMTKS